MTTGNVEMALRTAREELRILSPQSISWAAPVLFSSLPVEPIFGFLRFPPTCPVAATPQQQTARTAIWSALAQVTSTMRDSTEGKGLVDRLGGGLDNLENEVVQTILAQQAAVIRPGRHQITSGSSARIPVILDGVLAVEQVLGKLVVGGGEISIRELHPTTALRAAGFDIFRKGADQEVSFMIRRDGGVAALPEGVIFEAEVEVGPARQVFYTMLIDQLKLTPQASVCSGDNAVIVPA